MHRFVTTPIFYPNAKPHIGHLYSMMLADFVKALYKERGKTVFFSTGLDEHGNKVMRASVSQNVDINAFLSEKRKVFRSLASDYGLEYDFFVSTCDQVHIDFVLETWEKLSSSGAIYKGVYSGDYLVQEERFISPNEKKQYESDPRYNVDFLQEEGFFLKLVPFKDLEEEVQKSVSPRFVPLVSNLWQENRDVFITRKDGFGIEVNGLVIYVWFEALLNYLSTQQLLCSNPSETIHIIGADIVRFHSVMLFSIYRHLGIKQMPVLVVHGNIIDKNGEKVSKSLHNQPFELDDIKRNLSHIMFQDVVRAYLLSFEHENNFSVSYQDLLDFYKTNIVNQFSNLVHRVFSFINEKYSQEEQAKLTSENLQNIKQRIKDFNKLLLLPKEVELRPKARSEQFWLAIKSLNSLVNESCFWLQEKPTCDLVFFANAIKLIASFGMPLMPLSCNKVLKLFTADIGPEKIHREFNTYSTPLFSKL